MKDVKSWFQHQWLLISQSKSKRILLVILIPLIIITFWYRSVHSTLCSAVRHKENMLQQQYKETVELLQQQKQYNTAQRQYAFLHNQLKEYEKKFELTNQMNVEKLMALAKKGGCHLQTCQTHDTVDKKWYQSQRLKVVFSGTLAEVAKLFTLFEGEHVLARCPAFELASKDNNQFEVSAQLRFITLCDENCRL